MTMIRAGKVPELIAALGVHHRLAVSVSASGITTLKHLFHWTVRITS